MATLLLLSLSLIPELPVPELPVPGTTAIIFFKIFDDVSTVVVEKWEIFSSTIEVVQTGFGDTKVSLLVTVQLEKFEDTVALQKVLLTVGVVQVGFNDTKVSLFVTVWLEREFKDTVELRKGDQMLEQLE